MLAAVVDSLQGLPVRLDIIGHEIIPLGFGGRGMGGFGGCSAIVVGCFGKLKKRSGQTVDNFVIIRVVAPDHLHSGIFKTVLTVG